MFKVFKYLYGEKAKCRYDEERKICIVDYVDSVYVGYRTDAEEKYIRFRKREELSVIGMKRAYVNSYFVDMM